MAKQKLKTPKKLSFTERFNIPRNDIEHHEALLRATERAITNQGTSLDELFSGQADRLRREIAELKKKK
jgi:hypothetical protein